MDPDQSKDLTVVNAQEQCVAEFEYARVKTVSVVPLKHSNYCTWNIQCKMAFIKDGLWGIVIGTETAPTEGVTKQANFTAKRIKPL